MKKFLMVLVTVFCGLSFLTSCDDDDNIKGSTDFYGKVIVNPTSAKPNENVSFSIGTYAVSSGGTTDYGSSTTVDVSTSIVISDPTVNGKEVVKSVSYFIDGNKVGESSDKDNKYALSYRVENLSAGSHVVTAKCSSNFKNITIEEHIIQGELVVE